jgi:hypothetical protein
MNKIFAISDLEGFYPEQVLPMYNQIKERMTDNLIICGDIMDSTIKTQITKEILKLKSNNIKTIYDIVTNPNIFLTFGNRDLNKIKVGPLTELYCEEQNVNYKILIDKFNKGELENLDKKTYNKFLCIEKKRWYQKMSNWYPFWGEKIKDKINYWKDDNEPLVLRNKENEIIKSYNFFEKRFLKIFGADTSIGTMTADNLLQTIPIELGLYDEKDSDYNAFVVLAVFKSMLQKVKFNDDKKLYNILYNPIETQIINQSIFKGLLFTLFTDDKNNMIIKRTDLSNTYLFSHGGVSSEIIERNTLEELECILKNPITNDLIEKITDATKFIGGYYNKIDINKKVDIDKQIQNFNLKMKEIINKIFNEDYKILLKPSINILLLLIIAGITFDCKTFYSKILQTEEAVSKCKDYGILNINSNLISTMAGIRELRSQKKIFYYGTKLFNIFGHNPNGFGPTVDLFENDINKTYLVNLDSSNSFLSTSSNQSLYEQTKKTSSYILIENNKIKLITKIFIKIKSNEEIIIVDNNESLFSNLEIKKEDDEIQNNIKNNIVLAYSEGKKPSDIFEICIDNYIDDNMDEKLKLFKDNEKIFYHGKYENNLIFNYRRILGPPYPRCLFIVDENIFIKRYLYYKKKYLKYKQKYINLKTNF